MEEDWSMASRIIPIPDEPYEDAHLPQVRANHEDESLEYVVSCPCDWWAIDDTLLGAYERAYNHIIQAQKGEWQ